MSKTPDYEQYSATLHKDTLKLRILATNSCNHACAYCLNDFQKKGKEFINSDLAIQVLRAYGSTMGTDSEIYFSGGEPSTHPEIAKMARFAGFFNPKKLVMCTNGSLWKPTLRYYDWFTELHCSLHPTVFTNKQKYQSTYKRIHDMVNRAADVYHERLNACQKVVISFVYEPKYWESLAKSIDSLYAAFNRHPHVVFKIWGNHFRMNDLKYVEDFRSFVEERPFLIHRGFTLKQVNRGPFCDKCTENCVTLKAIWLFPDGEYHVCPRRKESNMFPTKLSKDYTLEDMIRDAKISHGIR